MKKKTCQEVNKKGRLTSKRIKSKDVEGGDSSIKMEPENLGKGRFRGCQLISTKNETHSLFLKPINFYRNEEVGVF